RRTRTQCQHRAVPAGHGNAGPTRTKHPAHPVICSAPGSRGLVGRLHMKTRTLGPFEVNAIGLGCMSMSHAYGTPDPVEAERTLLAALDIGYNFLDTAALYGFGKNEELIGRVLDRKSVV